MSELYSNFAISSLAAGIGASDLTLQVKTGKGALFPSPTGSDFFRLVLIKKSTGDKEIAFCTARSVDTLTITRAQEGTTALVLNADDPVENRPTAGFFASLSLTSTEVQANEFNYAADTGVASAYVATLAPVPAAVGAGFRVDLLIGNSNNSATVTLNANSLGAISVKRIDGTNPMVGDLRAGEIASFIHDGTNWILLNPYHFRVESTRPIYNAAGTAIITSTMDPVYHEGNIEVRPYSLELANAFEYANLSTGANDAGTVTFNDDGTLAFYLTDTFGGQVVEVALSTAWDITSGTHLGNVFSPGFVPQEMHFNADGTRLYLTANSSTITQFTLSTAWDITTASSSGTLDTSVKTSTCRGIFVYPTGSYLFVVGNTEKKIFRYLMSTLFSLNTASFDGEIDISWVANPGCLRVELDLRRGWIQDDYRVHRIAYAGITSFREDAPVFVTDSPRGFSFGDSGHRFYWAGTNYLRQIESHSMRVIR